MYSSMCWCMGDYTDLNKEYIPICFDTYAVYTMYCVGIHPDDTAYDQEIDATSGTEQSTVAVINNQTPAVVAEYQSNTRATVAARQSANPSTPQVSYYITQCYLTIQLPTSLRKYVSYTTPPHAPPF